MPFNASVISSTVNNGVDVGAVVGVAMRLFCRHSSTVVLERLNVDPIFIESRHYRYIHI